MRKRKWCSRSSRKGEKVGNSDVNAHDWGFAEDQTASATPGQSSRGADGNANANADDLNKPEAKGVTF